MDIKSSFGHKPVKEAFSLDERKEVPLANRLSSYGNAKEIISVKLKGSPVRHSDKMTQNKSDYTQRGEY